jgi:tetratricopeptide (TPR) repeat protein
MATAPSEATQEQTFKYWAFISYSHRDRKWGDWIHRSLETYRVPKRIVGQPTRDGVRPKRLFPIFRDREELPVSADLGTQINEALIHSRYLIVVCSPHSAKSIWVNEEIKLFKRLGREDRVLALIVAGEPNASEGKPGFSVEDECFPQGLRYRIGSDSEWSSTRTEPVAGDAREGKDGKTNAKLKLLAGLLDANFDALRQREQERRRRLMLRVTGFAGLITIAMSLIAGYAVLQAREAKKQKKLAVAQEHRAVAARKSAEDILNYLLNQLSQKLQPLGHLDVIEDVQKQVETYYKNLGFNRQDPNALNNWANLLQQEGDRLIAQGNLESARAKYEEFLGIMRSLVKENPGNGGWLRDLSVSYNKLGDVLKAQGDLTGANAQYQSSLQIMQNLVKQDPGNSDWQRYLSVSYNLLGYALETQGDLTGAKAQFQSSLEVAQKLVKQDPGNTGWQRDLSISYQNLGDVLEAQGDLKGAKAQYQRFLEILQNLVRQNPGNSGWQRDLSVSYDSLGEVLEAQGDLKGAKAQYQSDLEIAQKLVKQDPGNSGWQRDLSVSYNKVGEVLEAQGDLTGANAQYQSSLEIMQNLVKQDPGNSDWQADLSFSYTKLGNVLRAQGDVRNARADFRASLEILTNLMRAHGENPAWKSDLDSVKKELGE